RYSLPLEKLRSSPGRFLRNLQAEYTALRASVPTLGRIARAAGAVRMALDAGDLLEADEATRDAWRKRESTPPFPPAGRYQPPPTPLAPLMTIQDVEASLALVRAELQAAIDVSRGESDA